jgi:pimeloyl-ACP methyl ester carboxylesterase
MRHCNLKNVVLVGHSFGGTVVQKVAEQVPARIASLVFLDALILEHNQRVFDVLPSVFLDSLTSKNAPAVASVENTGHILPPPPWETWRDNFIQLSS